MNDEVVALLTRIADRLDRMAEAEANARQNTQGVVDRLDDRLSALAADVRDIRESMPEQNPAVGA